MLFSDLSGRTLLIFFFFARQEDRQKYIGSLLSEIVRVSIVLKRTVVVDND